MFQKDVTSPHDEIVSSVIEGYKTSPIDILGIGDAQGEYKYLLSLKDTYVRTVRDVDALFETNRRQYSILEVGAFLGPVSLSLKEMGYDISATDIPEFSESSNLRNFYARHGIPFIGLNLRNQTLPYESNSFDCVIICEVLEHLSFNPLPVIAEINRVLKDGGFIYIGMPNQAKLRTRLKAAFGQSVHGPIEGFFNQLDRNKNMIVGLHWREYTLAETVELIERMGFEVARKYYFYSIDKGNEKWAKNFLKKIVFLYKPFRPLQVVVGKKTQLVTYDFWLTEANS